LKAQFDDTADLRNFPSVCRHQLNRAIRTVVLNHDKMLIIRGMETIYARERLGSGYLFSL